MYDRTFRVFFRIFVRRWIMICVHDDIVVGFTCGIVDEMDEVVAGWFNACVRRGSKGGDDETKIMVCNFDRLYTLYVLTYLNLSKNSFEPIP